MKIVPLLILACLGIALAIATVYHARKIDAPKGVACTQEAKLCPDGSYVGRVGPSCEFAACPSSHTTTGASLGSIVGRVLLSPVCPVEHTPPDTACAPKGYATEVEARVPGSEVVAARLVSGSDGSYMFNLPPGNYEVHAKGGDRTLPTCDSRVVTVKANETTELLLSCDTGIR